MDCSERTQNRCREVFATWNPFCWLQKQVLMHTIQLIKWQKREDFLYNLYKDTTEYCFWVTTLRLLLTLWAKEFCQLVCCSMKSSCVVSRELVCYIMAYLYLGDELGRQSLPKMAQSFVFQYSPSNCIKCHKKLLTRCRSNISYRATISGTTFLL